MGSTTEHSGSQLLHTATHLAWHMDQWNCEKWMNDICWSTSGRDAYLYLSIATLYATNSFVFSIHSNKAIEFEPFPHPLSSLSVCSTRSNWLITKTGYISGNHSTVYNDSWSETQRNSPSAVLCPKWCLETELLRDDPWQVLNLEVLHALEVSCHCVVQFLLHQHLQYLVWIF